jgi:hypothetical protein
MDKAWSFAMQWLRHGDGWGVPCKVSENPSPYLTSRHPWGLISLQVWWIFLGRCVHAQRFAHGMLNWNMISVRCQGQDHQGNVSDVTHRVGRRMAPVLGFVVCHWGRGLNTSLGAKGTKRASKWSKMLPPALEVEPFLHNVWWIKEYTPKKIHSIIRTRGGSPKPFFWTA